MNDQWFYGENGEQRGPISLAALRDRIAAGLTRGDDLVWRDGMAAWTAASSVPELADSFRTSGVPPMPPFGGGYAAPQQYGYDANVARLTSSATTAMWFGIVAVLGSLCCAPIGIGFGIAAIVKGRNARMAPNAGAATAGVICGWIGLVLGVLSLVFGIIRMPEIMREIERQQQRQMQSTSFAPSPK